jgi:hypothetical protein
LQHSGPCLQRSNPCAPPYEKELEAAASEK